VNRADTGTRKATTGLVAAVALSAARDSYTHIYHNLAPGSTTRACCPRPFSHWRVTG
jgi:hypothetical protein